MKSVTLLVLFLFSLSSVVISAEIKDVTIGQSAEITRIKIVAPIETTEYETAVKSLAEALDTADDGASKLASIDYVLTGSGLGYIKGLLEQSRNTTDNLNKFIMKRVKNNPLNDKIVNIKSELAEISAYTFGQERIGSIEVKNLDLYKHGTISDGYKKYRYIVGPGLDETEENEREVIVVDCSLPSGYKHAIGLLKYAKNNATLEWDPRLYNTNWGFLVYHNINDLGPAAMKHMQCDRKPVKKVVKKTPPVPQCESTCGSVVENKAS